MDIGSSYSTNMSGDSHEQRDSPAAVIYRVVKEVADREGTEPLELSPPLYEAIDPEVLEDLLSDTSSRERREDIRLQFPYCGYKIVVKGNGIVEVSNDASASK